MSKTSTLMMWTATILLVGVYLFPLWVIHLQAPQYPQGLGIHIWIYKITGAAPHDLQNINGLNHYIGMKAIEPDSIPELSYMKYLLAGLIGFAAITAFVRKRWLLLTWSLCAIAFAAAGMYDFYRWECNYGHDLDPAAAIKIAGMSYQPPMFGTKQLLNFHTTAWPGIGGMCAMLAVGLGALAFLFDVFRARRHRNTGVSVAAAGRRITAAAALLLVAGGAGCSSGPRAIDYGVSACEFCRMTISDERYAAQIVSRQGRAYMFDAVECMANAVLSGDPVTGEDIGHLYVTDFTRPRTLVPAASATFLKCRDMPSPMGEDLTAFASREDAISSQREHGGQLLDFEGVKTQLSTGPGARADS